MKCRSDRIYPWPQAAWPLPGVGKTCEVYIYARKTASGLRFPAIEALIEISSGGNKEVQGDVRKALGMLIHYSNTDPRQRPMQGRRRPHPWRKENVKAETGVEVAALSFGEGAGTQARVYAIDLDGLPPKVLVLTVYYKRNGDDGWPKVAPILKDLQEGR